MVEGEELGAIARRVIDSNQFITIGTADEEGVPWVAPVWYAPASVVITQRPSAARFRLFLAGSFEETWSADSEQTANTRMTCGALFQTSPLIARRIRAASCQLGRNVEAGKRQAASNATRLRSIEDPAWTPDGAESLSVPVTPARFGILGRLFDPSPKVTGGRGFEFQ